MKTLIRNCRLCRKSTKHSIIEVEVRPYLNKETSICSQCETTLNRFVDTYEEDKIVPICYRCKKETRHFKSNWGYHQCTICGEYKK